MTEKKTLGVYIHIPFCKQKCLYCDFYSLPNQEEKMDAYVGALIQHIEEASPKFKTYIVDTVYFGGGTPTYLGTERLLKILDTIFKKFQIKQDAEITLEANPESCQDSHSLKQLKQARVNRISLGVQSTDDCMLQTIGRIHDYQDVQTAVQSVRNAQISNLSIDLMYGLPGQTESQWQNTLKEAILLQPEHMSCYGLKVEYGTPLYKNQAMYTLPDDDLQADMYLWTVEFLKENGYAQYEISNFAKSGYESRHNCRYWTMKDYIGFGPGAHSNIRNCRFAYSKDLNAYIAGRWEFSEKMDITLKERAKEYIMLSLRTANGIHKQDYENLSKRVFTPLENVFEKLENAEYAQRTEDGWRLTPRGFYVSNSIILLLQETAFGNDSEKRNREAI